MTPAGVHVLRVFARAPGEGGNALGVVLSGEPRDAEARQRVAAALGYAETVFVDDPASGRLAIYTPESELALAGHPLVGTAWLLAREGLGAGVLRPPAGEVEVRADERGAAIAAPPEWAPEFELVELESPEAVDALEGPPGGRDWVGAWAWIDKDAGTVRERVFVAEVPEGEDEATGAAALRLCARLGRPIEIHQGRASLIHARPLDDGRVEISGLVDEEGVRELPPV